MDMDIRQTKTIPPPFRQKYNKTIIKIILSILKPSLFKASQNPKLFTLFWKCNQQPFIKLFLISKSRC